MKVTRFELDVARAMYDDCADAGLDSHGYTTYCNRYGARASMMDDFPEEVKEVLREFST